MTLVLQNLFPEPLKASARPSHIWQQEVALSAGERVFVQAPSGTGKSTLIHLLYGLRADYDGKALWDGRSLQDLKAETLAEWRTKKLSIIFQDLRLFPELTAWENLDIKRSLTDTISAEEAEEWLNRLGLKERKDATVKTLSYGERQRVTIIRALLQPFEWLLMDEPFSHLDAGNTEKAATLIQEVCNRNRAAFLYADLDDNAHFPYTRKLLL